MPADRGSFRQVGTVWQSLVADLRRHNPTLAVPSAEQSTRYLLELIAFRRAAGHADLDESLPTEGVCSLGDLLAPLAERYTSGLVTYPGLPQDLLVDFATLRQADRRLALVAWSRESLGPLHEYLLGQRWRGGQRATRAKSNRRLDGIFYTPDCVVQYIVRKIFEANSGGWPDTKMPKILDPACGCGAFLSDVFSYLACQESVSADPCRLLKQIHGIDLDPLAVLTARRVLWLAAMCHDGCAEIITGNIRSGNALTGRELVGEEGQFDAVIGNPPYRRELNTKSLLDAITETDFGRRYRSPRMDLWYYFVHRALELLKPGGRMSLIVNSYWMQGAGAAKLIRALREETQVEEIFSLGTCRVFSEVNGRHMILTVAKGKPERPTVVKRIVSESPAEDAEPYLLGQKPVETYRKPHAQLFHDSGVDIRSSAAPCLQYGSGIAKLGDLGIVRQGIAENPATVTRKAVKQHGRAWQVGDGVFTLSTKELEALDLPTEERQLVRPYHDLCDLGRYSLTETASRQLIYTTAETCPDIEVFPGLHKHLARFQPIMEARRETRSGSRAWWQLHWPRDPMLWSTPKLAILQMAPRPAAVPVQGDVCVSFSANVFVPGKETQEHLNYLAAVLNSRLLWSWFQHHAKQRGIGVELNGHVLVRAPIRRIDFTIPTEREAHDQIVRLVDRRMNLGRGTSPEADSLDQQIDQRIEKLYGAVLSG